MKFCYTMLLICLLCAPAYAEDAACQQLKEQGSVTNLKTMREISEFVVDGEHSANTIWNKHAIDDHPVYSVIVNNYSDGDQINFATVAPNRGNKGGSNYAYLRVWFTNQSPMELKNTVFKDWKYSGSLGRTSMLKINSLTVYLVPQASGTIIVKTEMGGD